MTTNFIKGDVVQLKSSGLKMTVIGETMDSQAKTLIDCRYFEVKEQSYKRDQFPPEALKIVPGSRGM